LEGLDSSNQNEESDEDTDNEVRIFLGNSIFLIPINFTFKLDKNNVENVELEGLDNSNQNEEFDEDTDDEVL